jgi:hypothetical protein
VKLSELSSKMRHDAKVRQQGIDTETYRARRQVARIILAHECNMMQPSRRAAGRTPQDETRPSRSGGVCCGVGTRGFYGFPRQADEPPISDLRSKPCGRIKPGRRRAG